MASEAFVEAMVAQGVTDIFGIVGSAFMDALDIFPEAGIRFISVQHEQNAGHMADGYSRISGKHGVCIAQKRTRNHELRDTNSSSILGTFSGGLHHTGGRYRHKRIRGIP